MRIANRGGGWRGWVRENCLVEIWIVEHGAIGGEGDESLYLTIWADCGLGGRGRGSRS